MRFLFCSLLILAVSALVAARTSRDDERAERAAELRSDVLRHLYGGELGAWKTRDAYERLFDDAGPTGLKDLEQDADTSIALQAAWERHRKIAKRATPVEGRPDWVFDQSAIEGFLRVATQRLQDEPPAWWAALLKHGETIPEKHIDIFDQYGEIPGLLFPESPIVETDGTEVLLKLEGEDQTIRAHKEELDWIHFFPEGDSFSDTPAVALSGDKLSFIARPSIAGVPFRMVCVGSRTGRSLWEATIWAARRSIIIGPASPGPVEIHQQEGTVIVYGCGTHAMYAEGFDATTGTCRFRFCTSGWGICRLGHDPESLDGPVTTAIAASH